MKVSNFCFNFLFIYLSIIHADGMAIIITPTSIRAEIHELSCIVTDIGVSMANNLAIIGELQPIELPTATANMEAK